MSGNCQVGFQVFYGVNKVELSHDEIEKYNY